MEPIAPAAVSPATTYVQDIQIKLLQGAQIQDHASAISPLLGIYREWPYLYQQTDPKEDVDYIRRSYVVQPESIACIAYQGQKAVGVAMGVPLTSAPPNYLEAFPDDHRRPDIFYWGELVVLPEHRHQQIASQIYTKMGGHLVESGKYRAICFASLERPDNYRLGHLKPADFVAQDALWIRLGFTKREDLKVEGNWTVIGDREDSSHPMFFWWKELA